MKTIQRRSFLTQAAALTAAIPFSHVFGQTVPVKIRRNVNDLAVDDPIILAYKKAVEVMRSRPATDPRSWTAQASIHQNFCPHSNWFFLPWHRSYLAWFEDICREACGDDSFALPYWNWTKDPQVPKHFWGDDNPLNHERDITADGVIDAEFVGETVMKNSVLATKDFEIFASSRSPAQRLGQGTGLLEGTPHNNVHVSVGGDMLTFMSPLDPIFWLHHANVDRVWTEWNRMGNANTSNAAWLNFVFTNNFVNRQKEPQSPKIGTLLNTETLGYRYDDAPAAPPAVPLAALFKVNENAMVAAANDDSAVPKVPFEVALQPSLKLRNSMAQMAASFAAPTPREPEAIRLRLSEIEPPKDNRVKVRVFINCNYLTTETPLNSPSYVGSFCFFGLDHAHGADAHGHGNAAADPAASQTSFVFDITKTIARLKRSGGFTDTDDITVQLLAIPGTGAGTPLSVGKFTIETASAAG